MCQGDTIMAEVINEVPGQSTAIHWHGLHQRDSMIHLLLLLTLSILKFNFIFFFSSFYGWCTNGNVIKQKFPT